MAEESFAIALPQRNLLLSRKWTDVKTSISATRLQLVDSGGSSVVRGMRSEGNEANAGKPLFPANGHSSGRDWPVKK
jgi:hypothetical protein